jgi:hypothetical protein
MSSIQHVPDAAAGHVREHVAPTDGRLKIVAKHLVEMIPCHRRSQCGGLDMTSNLSIHRAFPISRTSNQLATACLFNPDSVQGA